MYHLTADKSIILCGLLLLFGIFADHITLVDGMKCYNCNSTAYPDLCGGNFKGNPNITQITIDNCEYCLKYHMKSADTYVRNCTLKETNSFKKETGCKEITSGGMVTDRCACNDNYCNGGNDVKTRTHFMYLCIALFLVLYPFLSVY